jgi:hypothetical protein
MRYDEYAIEKFKSLVMDYYTLTPFPADKAEETPQNPPNKAEDGTSNKSKDLNTVDEKTIPVVDKMLAGYRNTAKRIVLKYVENIEDVEKTLTVPKVKLDPKCIPTIQEVVMLEKCIIRFLPPVEMYMRGITIEHKYSEFVGDTLFGKIKAGFKSAGDNTDESIIARRTEIDFMLQSICDSYTSAMHRDQYRFRIWAISLATLISLYGVIVSLLFLWWGFVFWTRPGMPGFWQYIGWLLIPFMGSLGAFISVQYRNEKLPIRGDVMRTALELNSGLLGVCFRICIGAVFAILLNLFFVANFMNDVNPVTPTVDGPKGGGLTNAFQFMFGMQLLSSVSVAKILCWSLVAGFAEQLIPDQLSRITKKLESEDVRTAGTRVDATVPNIVERPPSNPDQLSKKTTTNSDDQKVKTLDDQKQNKPTGQ